jgi:hypothetical protein
MKTIEAFFFNKIQLDSVIINHISSEKAMELMVQVSIPRKGKRFFPFPKCLNCLCGPPSLLSNVSWGILCLGVRQPGYEVDHSLLSDAEVRNEWSKTSTPPHCLHDMHRVNVTFTCVSTEMFCQIYVHVCILFFAGQLLLHP